MSKRLLRATKSIYYIFRVVEDYRREYSPKLVYRRDKLNIPTYVTGVIKYFK